MKASTKAQEKRRKHESNSQMKNYDSKDEKEKHRLAENQVYPCEIELRR